MEFRLRVFPWAWYVGAFYSKRWSRLYIHVVPVVGIEVRFSKSIGFPLVESQIDEPH